MTDQDITDPITGKSRLLAERCATCIFRPGNPMHLQPGRLAHLVADALARGSYIVCHDTLTYGPHPDYGPANCRGFHDAYRHRSLALRLARLQQHHRNPHPTRTRQGMTATEPTPRRRS